MKEDYFPKVTLIYSSYFTQFFIPLSLQIAFYSLFSLSLSCERGNCSFEGKLEELFEKAGEFEVLISKSPIIIKM